ncbi:hypothetical protein Tco_0228920 [Tanacetum coccineum]
MCGNDDGGGRGSGVDRWSDDDDGVVGDEGMVVMMYGGGCRRRVTGIIGRKRGGAGKEEEGGRSDGASWSTVVQEGEPVDAAGSGATTSLIGAMTSRARRSTLDGGLSNSSSSA